MKTPTSPITIEAPRPVRRHTGAPLYVRRGAAGFTLIEIAAVVLVIGVLAAVVFPRLESSMPRHALRAASNEVLAAVALARSQARLKQYDVDLEYDIDKNTVSIMTYYGHQDGVLVQLTRPDVLMTRVMPRGAKISEVHYAETRLAVSGTTTATFRSSGAVGEHMVVLANEDGDTMAIFVPALTGAAFVVEGGQSYAQVRSQRRSR